MSTAGLDPDAPLKIAYLTYRGKPHVGGQGVYTRHLTKALADLGHSVEVFGGQPYPVLDGRITLTEPAILKAGYTDEDIARWGAQIIAEAPYLTEVSEYVRVQHSPYRRPGEEKDPDIPIISKIIKISSSYDQAVHELQVSLLPQRGGVLVPEAVWFRR